MKISKTAKQNCTSKRQDLHLWHPEVSLISMPPDLHALMM